MDIAVGVQRLSESGTLFPARGTEATFTSCHKKYNELYGRISVSVFVNICFEFLRTKYSQYYDVTDPRYSSCGKFGRQQRRVSAAKLDLLSLIDDIFCINSL